MATKKSEAIKFMEKLCGGPLTMAMIMKSHRLCEEMTQEKYAKQLGLSKQYLCDIEKGRRLVSPQLAAKIAKKTGYSVELYVKIAIEDLLRQQGLKYEVRVSKAA